MAMRLVELVIPRAGADALPALFEGKPVLQYWVVESGPESSVLKLLVDARDVEAVTDALVSRYGTREDFRLVSLHVEATVPAIESAAGSPEAGESDSPAPAKGPARISREELYEELAGASDLTRTFLIMVALSTIVAAVGLIRGDTAIVIGAMVIAPLLGPNVALSLACTLGDPELAKKSLRSIAAGFVIAALLSLAIGFTLPGFPGSKELASRTSAGFSDIALALAAGAAGSLAFTSGVPAVLVGVMVAVALLPPLVTAGLMAGTGHLHEAAGALVLLATNVTCVNLAAVAMFLMQRVRPRTWWETRKARQATRLAVSIWVALLVALFLLMTLGRIGWLPVFAK